MLAPNAQAPPESAFALSHATTSYLPRHPSGLTRWQERTRPNLGRPSSTIRFGTPRYGVAVSYPDDCFQAYIGSWWITDEKRTVTRGRLLRAFVPHVDLVPQQLVPEERSNPTDHSRALFRVQDVSAGAPASRSVTPVAALPQHK